MEKRSERSTSVHMTEQQQRNNNSLYDFDFQLLKTGDAKKLNQTKIKRKSIATDQITIRALHHHNMIPLSSLNKIVEYKNLEPYLQDLPKSIYTEPVSPLRVKKKRRKQNSVIQITPKLATLQHSSDSD